MTDEELDKLVVVLEKLSPDAFYLASLSAFGQRISYNFGMNDAVLMAPRNDRQRDAFNELMGEGLCYLDTERGVVGYRSTERGAYAYAIIQNSKKE